VRIQKDNKKIIIIFFCFLFFDYHPENLKIIIYTNTQYIIKTNCIIIIIIIIIILGINKQESCNMVR